MRSTAKYLFDNDFTVAREGKPSIALAEHAAKLVEAEASGYRKGFAAAAAEAKANAAAGSAAALELIGRELARLNGGLSAVEGRLEAEAVEVAVAVAKKLAAELVAREPLAEMAALAANCFRNLTAAPHVVVRINDALLSDARETLDEIVRAAAPQSRLVVLAEPDVAPGDCRIEWADGGIVRDSGATAAAVDEAVARYVGGRQATLR